MPADRNSLKNPLVLRNRVSKGLILSLSLSNRLLRPRGAPLTRPLLETRKLWNARWLNRSIILIEPCFAYSFLRQPVCSNWFYCCDGKLKSNGDLKNPDRILQIGIERFLFLINELNEIYDEIEIYVGNHWRYGFVVRDMVKAL